VKTTLLILFGTCLSLLAQAPVTNADNSADSAVNDAILRAVVRGDTSPAPAARPPGGPVAPVTVPTTAPAIVPVAAQPAPGSAAPVVPAFPAFPSPIAAAQAPTAIARPETLAEMASASEGSVSTRPVGPSFPPIAEIAGGRIPSIINPDVMPADDPPTNSFDSPGLDLNTFLDIYSQQIGRMVIRGANLNAPAITLMTERNHPLTKLELVKAMTAVLAMNGVVILDDNDRSFVRAVPAQEVPFYSQPFYSATASNLPSSSDQFVNEIIPLRFIKPSEMVNVLTPFARQNNMIPLDDSQMLIVRDYAGNVKRMLELVSQVDREVPIEYENVVIPIKYADAQDIASALGSLGGSVTTGIPGAQRAGSGLSRPGGSGIPGASGINSGINSPNPGAATPVSNPLGTPSSSASFANRLRSVVQGITGGNTDFKLFTGITKILPDQRSNSLMVFANASDMAMIKRIVRQLDVVLPQVLIEAIIMEVNLDDERNLGVSYLQTSPSTPGNYFKGIGAVNNGTLLNKNNYVNSGTNGFGSLPGGFSYAAMFGNDFDATLTAIATDSRINVLSKPRVQTSHGVQASLKVGDTIPYVTGTYFGGINGQASSQYQQTFVGIDLEVTPLINSDGLVVMDISQDIQQLGPSTTIDGNSVPTTTQRSAVAKVSVKDRDTIILGGFISSTKSKSHSGVPGLKDIPVLGYLFRSSSDSTKRVELIVLIRPTVLPTPDSAALAATTERNRLPGVKAAEAEYQRDENTRLKAADKITVPKERE